MVVNYTETDLTGRLTLGMELKSMSISYSPQNTIYSFRSKWVARDKLDNEWLAGGDFSFELEINGKKPRKLELTGMRNANLTPEERTAVAIAVKADLRSKARTCIDEAWRQMQTQTQLVW